jgi:hypothetical protein
MRQVWIDFRKTYDLTTKTCFLRAIWRRCTISHTDPISRDGHV